MRIISKERLQSLRKMYPVGCRVELIRMDDIQAPAIGTKGTVIGVDDIGRGAGFGAALVEFGGGNSHRQQNMFQLAHRRFRREDGENVETKGGRKFKSGQNHHLISQRAPLLQPLLFFRGQATLRLKLRQPVQLPANCPDACHGVVIRNGDDLQTLLHNLAQPR